MNLRGVTLVFAAIALLMSCSGEDGAKSQNVGSFSMCSNDALPAASPVGDIVIDDPESEAGEKIAFRWELDDPGAFVGPDLRVECWTGVEWVPVWVVRNVFGNAKAELVRPGAELYSDDIGLTSREGFLAVPIGTPSGTYRVGIDDNEVRFVVTS